MERTRKRLSLLAMAGGSALLLLAVTAGFARSGSAAAPQQAPRNTSPPTITGIPQEGQTLRGNRGEWANNPTDFNFQWRRCNRNGGSCSNISGANGATYRLSSVDVGDTIRFRVEAVNGDGRTFASSVPTAVIRPAAQPPPPARGCAAAAPVQVASISPPDRLNIDGQSISPRVVGRSTRTITVRLHVSCRGKSVQGAIVYAAGVPFNQFTIPDEQPTGADGWAQLTMTQLSGFPAARRQQLLVVFGRARKAGEPVLAGISTRRLISFPVDLRR
jgi:hypothetical protein